MSNLKVVLLTILWMRATRIKYQEIRLYPLRLAPSDASLASHSCDVMLHITSEQQVHNGFTTISELTTKEINETNNMNYMMLHIVTIKLHEIGWRSLDGCKLLEQGRETSLSKN